MKKKGLKTDPERRLVNAALCLIGETEPAWDYKVSDAMVVIITAKGAKYRLKREKMERVAALMEKLDRRALGLLRDEGLLGEAKVTEALLREVPGIGAVTAGKILAAISGTK